MKFDDVIQSIKLLEPKPNSVLLLKIKSYQMESFRELTKALHDRLGNILIVFHVDDINSLDDIEMKLLDEAEMNRNGWFRKKSTENIQTQGYQPISNVHAGLGNPPNKP